MRITKTKEITFWIQKPLLNVGINKWKEIEGRKAITIFFLFIGITFYS